MALNVTRAVLAQLRTEADRAAPLECCGILLGEGVAVRSARPARNVAEDPVRRFEIDPQALVDAHRAVRSGGMPVIGYYHSHPEGPPVPSAIDRAGANGDGSVWAIIGARDIAFWRDEEAGFVPLSYALEDR